MYRKWSDCGGEDVFGCQLLMYSVMYLPFHPEHVCFEKRLAQSFLMEEPSGDFYQVSPEDNQL